MKKILDHIRSYMLRGLLAIIPLLLCAAAVHLLYTLIDKRVMGFLANFFEVRQVPGLGLLILLVFLYLIGLIFSNILGREFLKIIEHISSKIPILGTIYGVGKQLTQSFSTEDNKHAFKKAALIRLSGNEMWVPGFIMGQITDRATKEELIWVYIPTVPTPTGGFVFIVKASQVLDPGWTVEECLKVIVSMGLISPKEI